MEMFPMDNLVPKKEIGVTEFLSQHPKFDGRGVLIGILDSGVDPSAPGLQVTSEKKPKIIDLIDPSGAGDVDTSAIRTVTNGEICGLSGRKLKIPKGWTNPSGKYHVGLKNIFELYPKTLRDRMKKERKEKQWDPLHRLACADAERQLEKFNKDHSGGGDLKKQLRLEKENLEAQVDVLTQLEKKYVDSGPILDCVVFNDGKIWRVCLDTTFRGKLDKCHLLSNYRENQEFAKLSEDDAFTYSVNVYENGNVLEICATSSSHGSHVSGIASAFVAETPERNGGAPGAQVVSFAIGDSRLEAMETGTSLVRALNKAAEMGVDVINYSYGEATQWPNSGRIISAIEEAVYKNNIIFVSCGGNNGPCLSTVGSPGGTSSACIAVAAYLTPDMMTTLYSQREKADGILYPWSSRGPANDGDLGLSVAALGGAITCVPSWTLKGNQLMNGTSMSSPNACGAIACLVSALKAQKIRYSPFTIRRALENTAKIPNGHSVLSIGNGLVQIQDAYEYMVKYADQLDHNVRYEVTVDTKFRGVYLRELHQQMRPREMIVNVEPKFTESSPNGDKVRFEKHLTLSCEASWVEHPSHLELMNGGRQFNIRVDTKELEAGKVHFTRIEAFEVGRQEMGPLFSVPITVIVPEQIADRTHFTVEYKQPMCRTNDVFRHFIHVPEGSDWAVLKFRSHDSERFSKFVIHSLQLMPDCSFTKNESFKMVTLSENGDTTLSFAVIGGRTMELCITKWWASIGNISASYDLAFHSLSPIGQRSLSMGSCEVVMRLDVKSSLQYEDLQPAVALKYLNQPLRPTDFRLRPLGPRDLLSDGRQVYEIVLNYHFHVGKACEVQPSVPMFSRFLYESEYENQLWMIFTSNKQLVASGEAFPWRYATKLEKGDYVIRYQFRHIEKERLEALKDLVCVVQYKLSTPINLDFYSTHAGAMEKRSGKKINGIVAAPHSVIPLYIAGVPDDKVVKPTTVGWYMSGHLTLAKDELAKKVCQFPFNYTITDVKKHHKVASGKAEETKETATTTKGKKETLDDAVRELKISWLKKHDGDTRESLYKDLISLYPNYLPLYAVRIRSLTEKGNFIKLASSIMEAADSALKLIDQEELLKYCGTKNDVSENASVTKTEMERKKAILLEALTAKANVTVELLLAKQDGVPKSVFGSATVGPVERESTEGGEADETSEDPAGLATASPVKDEVNPKSASGEEENKCAEPIIEFKLDESEDPEKEETGVTQEGKANLKEIDDLLVEILKWADHSDPKVVGFSIKHAIAHGHYGRALKMIHKHLEEKPDKTHENLCAELYECLGWIHAVNHQKNVVLVKYPPGDYRRF